VALIMCIPLLYFLIQQVAVARQVPVLAKIPEKWLGRGLYVTILLCVLSAVGSQSRGAFLAIAAMGVVLWWRSRSKLALGFAILMLTPALLMFMPEEWFGRMQTITTYQEDGSAQSRLNTWATIWNMALDRPFIGGGFRIGSDILYQLYSPGPWVKSFDSHSIYFQALGEHGFPGLFIYLALGITTWRMASRLAKLTQKTEYATWVPLLMSMIQVSIIGFATGGAFLGLLHFDFPYYLAAIVVLVKATIDEDKAMVKPHSLAQSNPLNIQIGGPNSDIKS